MSDKLLQVDDPVGEAIVFREPPGHFDHAGCVDRVHAGRSGPTGEEPEDAGAAAQIEHDVTGSN